MRIYNKAVLRKLGLILVLSTFLFIDNINGQTVTPGNVNTWGLLLNRFYLSEKLNITNELHERTGDFLKDQATFIFRPSVDYEIHDDVELSIGYSFVRSWPYSPYSQPIPKNEHNIWEQVFLSSRMGKVNIQHRFRFEHRFIDNIVVRYPNINPLAEVDGTTFANRFRYRIIVSFDLFKLNQGKHTIFFNGFDELWINQADNLLPQSYARNWIYTGIGYRFDKDLNIQLAHMHQYDANGANNFISSSIIQLSLFKNFKLY